MRKIKDVIRQGESLSEYLLSDSFVPDDSLVTKIEAGSGKLSLTIPDTVKKCTSFNLCIVGNQTAGERKLYVIAGSPVNEQLVFSLEEFVCSQQQSASWDVFLLAEDGDCFSVSPLKRSGLSISKHLKGQTLIQSKKKSLKSILRSDIIEKTAGSIAIWEARNIFQDTGVTAQGQANYRLLLRFNAGNNQMSLRWVSANEAEKIFEGTLNYLYRPEKKKKYPYVVSVVMAVYNVEDYLEDAIESILQQDIGFEEHVQLILVDDGSPDHSGDICDRFKTQYPNNVVVIHKENGGVASARNAGLAAAEGKYVNFMDSDDRITPNTLKDVVEFFDGQTRRVDVVTFPIMFFEGKTGPHWQNYKFDNGNRVINLWNEYTASDMSVSASLFKTEEAKKHSFDPSLPNGEDLKFIAEILLEKMALGVVTSCCYYYRRRNAGGSLINTSHMKKSWYFEYFQNMVEYLFAYSKKKIGYVPAFIQNTIMMDLQWRFGDENYPDGVLSDQEKKKYYHHVVNALRKIDDQIIISQQHMHMERAIQAFSMKYGRNPDVRYTDEDFHLIANKQYITSASRMVTFYDFITYNDGILTLEGTTILAGLPESMTYSLYIVIAGDYYLCDETTHSAKLYNCLGCNRVILGFKASIPLKAQYMNRRVRLAVKTEDNHLIIRRKYRYHKFTPFFKGLANNYYLKDGVLFRGGSAGLFIEKPEEDRLVYEEQFIASLEETIIDTAGDNILPDQTEFPTREVFDEVRRLREFAINYKKERPVWLISDRIDRAGDNGEALFLFLMSQKDLPADVYFVIGGDSPDYERMKQSGPTLIFGTEDHLKMHLVADLIVSSQGEDFIFTPFARETEQYDVRKYYADLICDQKFVFLQHGIIKDDLSGWLNRYAKNIYGFVTSAPRETESILSYSYDYDAERVWQTGLPRFDRLYEDDRKWITICPTWRKYLRDLTERQFKESTFYGFYAKLLSDAKLHEKLKDDGYTLCLRLHPSMMQFVDLFTQFEDVKILDDSLPYRQMYAQTSVLITDYSSTAMEFAYMRKPVIYAQFDRDEMFSGMHTYVEGYYDYQKDGFGPITQDAAATVDAIIEMIDNCCKPKEIYQQRIEEFFPANDYQNCQRMYEKLLAACGIGVQ